MSKETRLQVRATPEELSRWSALAKRGGRTLSQLARYLLNRFEQETIRKSKKETVK